MYHLLDSISSPDNLKSLSYKELEQLCGEVRKFLLEHISRSGGHLASNLGVVELTVALHYVFNSPFDRIVWDVGHQSYVHKILTQRKELFPTLRQYGGLSGFPKRQESEHDVFETGHSSTSISAALGMARARDINGQKHHVVAIIGDGALTGGMAFEALNDVGHSKTNLIVVLNDNEMSISKNVGALSGHLSRIRSSARYNRLKKGVENLIGNAPIVGKPVVKGIERIKNSFKYLVVPGVIFEEMGFTYMGPIEGHNVTNLISILRQASKLEGPTFVHVVTKKGKGYPYAEENPELFHGVPPFTVNTGKLRKSPVMSYSKAFGSKLVEMAKQDKRVVAITAAMPESTGLTEFRKCFPKRFFDVGIAEQHAVTLAAGLAASGMKPYVAIYSTFLQRAYDQILHDVCIQNLPVVFAIDRAGLVGEDGETHQGVFDVSFLRHIPNMTLMAPRNIVELHEMLDYSIKADGPVAIRYPKGYGEDLKNKKREPMDGLNWEILTEGRDCCIFTFGKMADIALKVSELLKEDNIAAQVVNARVIKPLDVSMLEYICRNNNKWVTLEENVIQGGFGSFINEFVVQQGYIVSILNLGIPDKFIPHGSVEELLEDIGLDPYSIASRIKTFINSSKEQTYVSFQGKA